MVNRTKHTAIQQQHAAALQISGTGRKAAANVTALLRGNLEDGLSYFRSLSYRPVPWAIGAGVAVVLAICGICGMARRDVVHDEFNLQKKSSSDHTYQGISHEI